MLIDNDFIIPKYSIVRETNTNIETLAIAENDEKYKEILKLYEDEVEKIRNDLNESITLKLMNMEEYIVIKEYNNYNNI